MATPLELPIALESSRSSSVPRSIAPIRIGDLRLDPDSLELTDGDRVEVLRPLPAALLFHLLRHRHRIVPKEELHRVLWPDTSVSDAALASAVRDLRRILADDGEAQEIVRTFRGRGYRLVAPVEVASRDGDDRPDAGADEPARAAENEFVGRERELARFERVRLAAEAGRGGTLLVESVSGGGRSAFLAACARRTSGVLWLGIRCRPEPWVPRYDAVTRVLLELEGAIGSDLVEDWVRHDPDLAHLLPDVLQPEPGPAPRLEALAAAFRRIMDRASQMAPVVVAIDDVHAIDPASLELLCTGAARPALLVATADLAGHVGGVGRGLDALFSERSRLRLGGLTSADISHLARALPQSRVDARWAARIRERTGGHPADVQAVIHELDASEQHPDRATPLLPRAVFERISRRIEALSRPARALVTAGAALPPGAGLERIERLADVAPLAGEAPIDPVDECMRAGLMGLRTQPTRVELSGQFVRHVALAGVGADRRRELERRAMEVLRATAS